VHVKIETRYATDCLCTRACALSTLCDARNAPADDLARRNRGTIEERSPPRSRRLSYPCPSTVHRFPSLLLPPPALFLCPARARFASTHTSAARPSVRPSHHPRRVHEDRCNRLYKTVTVTSARDILSHASRANGPTGQALHLATISSLPEAKGIVEQKRDTITDSLVGREGRTSVQRCDRRYSRGALTPRIDSSVPSRPVPSRPFPSLPSVRRQSVVSPSSRVSPIHLSLSLFLSPSLCLLLIEINDDVKRIGSVCHDSTMDRCNLLISRWNLEEIARASTLPLHLSFSLSLSSLTMFSYDISSWNHKTKNRRRHAPPSQRLFRCTIARIVLIRDR